MAPSSDEKGAAEYGREALDQFREAARYGAMALAERKAARGVSKGASKAKGASKGTSELGELADAALARFGKKGKLAAKAGIGHRVVDRLLPELPSDSEDESPADAADTEATEEQTAGDETTNGEVAADDHLFDARTPLPIQESIDVAVPVAAVFDLSTRFEELPRFSDRIVSVEAEDDAHLDVVVKLGGRRQNLAVEIVGEEPEERLDWDGVEGVEHSGVVTFHPLAPRLTRVELTIEQSSERLRERLLRTVGLPERTVRQELRRFKAYAELWDEANDYKSADFKDPASEPPADEEAEDEEEEEEEEEPDEEPEEAEEPPEDEEAEPADQG